jgi:hypothetical protein
MAKKKGDFAIKPEQRLLWLKRHDSGESFIKIAADEHFDYRTVRKHVEIARSERELKDERSAVMRGALEHHFMDLLNVVDTMLFCLETVQAIEFSGDNEFINDAFHQHIPHSPIWQLVRRWNACVTDLTKLETSVRQKLESRLSNDKKLSAINERKSGEMVKRIHTALKYNPNDGNQKTSESNLQSKEGEERFILLNIIKTTISGFVDLNDKESVAVKDALSKIDEEMESWDEFNGFEDIRNKLTETKMKLKDELRVLKWKRIVPGRCRLCPM